MSNRTKCQFYFFDAAYFDLLSPRVFGSMNVGGVIKYKNCIYSTMKASCQREFRMAKGIV